MRSLAGLVSVLVGLSVITLACQTAPKVAQGTVLALDAGNATLKLMDEAAPDQVMEFSLAEAEIGAASRPGDKVRVAYQERNGKLAATRVMKVAKD